MTPLKLLAVALIVLPITWRATGAKWKRKRLDVREAAGRTTAMEE